MALLTFPWDDVGDPNQLQVIDHSHATKHPYGGGYSAAGWAGTRIQKSFPTVWEAMSPAQWLAMVEFFRQVGSVVPFYWEFPVELYGSPGYGGYGGLEPDDGFDADQDVGYGNGPILTVQFDSPDLEQEHLMGFNLYRVAATFREVA